MVAETIGYTDISDREVGLGIAVIVTGIIAGILIQLTRRIRHMPAYFVANFQFFKDKHPKLPVVAAVFYYILLATPILLLIIWVIILGVRIGPNPALPILFIGIFIGLIFVPSFSNLFYYKVLGMFLAYITAECLTLGLVFDQANPTSFWTLTALSLTLNCLFVIVTMWFMDDNIWSIPDNVPSSTIQKIRAEVKIWKQKESPPEIITTGIYGKVANLSRPVRIVVITVTYIFSLVVLIIYSVVGKYRTIYNFQALVNSIAIVTTDIITFMLMVISKKSGFDPNINAIVSLSVRICIIAFSGDFWFFGYCLLYLILMLYISVLMINKYYPSFEKPPTAQVIKLNLLKMPEAAGGILLLMFSGLVYFMGVDAGKNLPIDKAKIGQSSFPFWAVGVSTILLSFSVFFYLITLRIVERSRLKVRSATMYYIGCEGCSEYYVFMFASYAFLVVLGFHLWSVVGRNIIWASCVFLPFFYQGFMVFYSNWVENDYLILGDVAEFNKKIKKRKQREQKIKQMRNSVIVKMKQENKQNQGEIMMEEANIRVMDNAQIEENWVVDNYQIHSAYSEWRQQVSFVEAFKTGKLLPTDKKIITSIPIMLIILVAYSLTFFYSENRDMTAFTVSVQIIVLFLIFVPTKRYFSTFQKPNVAQIVLFILGIVLNYAFGIISYAVDWNKSPAYTVLWSVVNPLLVFAYAAVSMLRDKGLIIPTVIICVISMIFSFGPGIILLAWFNSIATGIALLGAGFYYTYFLTTILIYKKMNNSVPFAIYIITIILIIGTCCAVMIYAFVDPLFDDFYGFSITYLVINLLGLFYAIYRVSSDILSRSDKPNFYSPYGSPIYKYDFNIKSVVQNDVPLKIWLISWFAFYVYTILMQIFIVDTNYGTSASMIPLTIFSLTFFYVVTYNANRAGKIKDDITEEILTNSWEEVINTRDKLLGNFLQLDELQKQLANAQQKLDNGQTTMKINISTIKINPKQDNKNDESEMNQTTTKLDPKKQPQQSEMDITHVIYNLQTKIEKATQNDKILLVNYWTHIMFKTQSKRKKRMLEFVNFIKDCADILASTGIALVINDSLYDLELIYNQAFQELHTLSAVQRVYFNKQLKLYLQRKQKEEKEREQTNNKQVQLNNKRQKELQNKILKDDKNNEDPNLPLEKMKDGPMKLKKIKQSIKTDYNDNQFRAANDFIPNEARGVVKGWKRPGKNCVIMKNQINSGMEVRQGMIGDCYLISAIGVLGKDRIRRIISEPSECPPGAYMVKFCKFGKDIYVIVDDLFPVADTQSENEWIFGRCEDKKQIFCNILEKAYAKLYGGYHNIVGGKVALALADMTGGFPEEIELKPYQETNTNEIFQKMIQFKNAGYLMGAGSPPNPKGDAVAIDGIYQGHAYLVLDVRNLDGNRLIKLRNPHGNQSKQSTLDWCDDSPKWTSRLKGLLGETMADDGAFWMGLDDFVYCFRALYICRIFDSSWKRVGPFAGQWKGQSAAGLKAKSGTAILANNPHYGIKVTKACTIFIELAQNESKDGSGKNQIFFMVQRNSGKRIDAPSTNKLAGMSGPAINAKTITKQINLTADSFPYTFSLMLAIYQTGQQGSYNLSMFCNDPNIQIIDNSVFGK